MPSSESSPLLPTTDASYSSAQPTTSRLQQALREPLAEFLATFLLVLVGDGVVAQTILSRGANGSWLGINVAWAGAVFLGTYLAGPISGSHINPAVTIALATFRGFSWRKVPSYIAAQMLGGFLGAVIVYINYWEQINLYEDGGRSVPRTDNLSATAGIFSTYPAAGIGSISSFISEFTASFILMLGLSAIGSPRSAHLSRSSAFAVFILMLCIGSAYGYQTGYAINAARDLAPRCFAYLIYGSEVFTAAHHYWWIPTAAPIVGCLAGAFTWNLLIGEEKLTI